MISYMGSLKSSRMKYFRKLLKDFEKAAEDLSWKGTRPPDEFEEIEENYKETKKKLINYVGSNIL